MNCELKKYPVNEIFYSLQGEGAHAGYAAIFIRFSGCNLKCPFCDTDHSSATPMTVDEILNEISIYPAPLVVLTGGEPSLYVDENLIEALHKDNRFVAIETNGTNPLPDSIDWVTFSPKIGIAEGADDIRIDRANEIKVVNVGQDLSQYINMSQRKCDTLLYLQPCFTSDPQKRFKNLQDTISKVKSNPVWHLSAQLHRFLQIP